MNGFVELEVDASMAVSADFTGFTGVTLRRGKDSSWVDESDRDEDGNVGLDGGSLGRDSGEYVEELTTTKDSFVLED